MENERLDLSRIDWEQVLPRLGVHEDFLSKNQGPCPICGGKTRFRFDNKLGHGTWYCNKCLAGNGITLVAKVNGWTNEDAFKAIMDAARIVPIRPYVVTARKEVSRDDLRSKLQTLWDEAVPVSGGDPVWRYVHHRVPRLGALPPPSDLRYHPSLEFWEQYKDARGRTRYKSRGKYPAALLKIRDREGRPVNLQRIYLSAEGTKANLRSSSSPEQLLKVKKQMTGVSKFTGGAIHLYAPDGTGRLGVGEGFETQLAVRAAYRNDLPVWACLSEAGLRHFIIPSWVKELHIFADNDPPDEKGRRPGQASAIALFRRALKEGFTCGTKTHTGKRVFLHVAKTEGTDFNDQWLELVKQQAA
ncbi:MAG: primase-helicase zinc-binding domain-containing protein [Georgfuchsia sp.]